MVRQKKVLYVEIKNVLDFDSSTEFVLQLHQDEIAKLDTRLNKLIEQKMMLTKMLYQESNPVPIMTVQASTSDLQV